MWTASYLLPLYSLIPGSSAHARYPENCCGSKGNHFYNHFFAETFFPLNSMHY